MLNEIKKEIKKKVMLQLKNPPVQPEARIKLSKLKKKLNRNIERDQENNFILENILNFARDEGRNSSSGPQYRYKKMGGRKRKAISIRRFINNKGIDTDYSGLSGWSKIEKDKDESRILSNN